MKKLTRSNSIVTTAMAANPSIVSSTETINEDSSRKNSIKPGEKEDIRPPWKPSISLVPQSKADRNAILRAKILEASRRAILKAKINGVACQTDPIPTKLMKDVSLDSKGLILTKEIGVLTDGSILIERKTGELILTHSVPIQTNMNEARDAATQTAIPQSACSLNRYLASENGSEGLKEDDIVENESKLLAQLDTLSEIDELMNKLNSGEFFKLSNGGERANGGSEKEKASSSRTGSSKSAEIDEMSSNDSLENAGLKNRAKTTFTQSHINLNTSAHWNLDLEFPSTDTLPSLPRRTHTEGEPWKNFKDIILGQRLSNMTLSPIPPRRGLPSANRKSVTWNDHQNRAVSDLLNEASNLICIFDKVSMLLGPDVKLNNIPPVEKLQLPPPKYANEVKASCEILEERLSKFEPRSFEPAEKLEPELMQYLNYRVDENP